MKTFNKLIAFFMIFVMLSALLVGCSTQINDEKPSDASVDLASETTEAKYLDGLPEKMDFEQETIRFICDSGTYNLTERSLISEDITGDIVDDAVYKRNGIVMDRFNCGLEIVKTGGMAEVAGMVRQSVLSNSDDYDVVAGYMYYTSSLASEGVLLNLNSLPNFDFTQPYWSQNVVEGMTYKDASYWCTGDLSLRYIGGMYVTFVNKTIWEDYFPDVDYYQLAMDGEWTLSKLYDMTSVVYDDVNNNGKSDSNDIYGFIVNANEDPVEALVMSADVSFSDRDDDGIPYLSYDTDMLVSCLEVLHELIHNNPGAFSTSNDDNVTVMKQFASGQAMCVVNKLFQSEVYLRDMENDFAIIPVPKFDEIQESYNTILHDGLTLFGIPLTNSKIEMTTAVMEALAAESYRTVTPVYYEMALKVKYVRDDMSAIMIDLIREGVNSDFAFYYSVGDITHFIRGLASGTSTAFASSVASKEQTWEADMEQLLENLEKYAD